MNLITSTSRLEERTADTMMHKLRQWGKLKKTLQLGDLSLVEWIIMDIQEINF
jgi:hypothetical protein